MGVYRADTRTRGWLEAAGYSVRTTFTRMRVDLDPDRRVEVPPTDVVVRRVTEEADVRRAHEIEEASFLEHYGNVPITFEAGGSGCRSRDPTGRGSSSPRSTASRSA